MNITGLVRTAEDVNAAIPFANVYISDSSGKPTGAGTATDNNGSFTLDANNGDYVTASIVGRGNVTKQLSLPSTDVPFWYLPMGAGSTLQDATVNGKAPFKINWTYVGLGVVGLAIIAVIVKKYVIKK